MDMPSQVRSLWRNRDFLLLWSGQCISTLGSYISGLALPLLVLALTHSPAQAGLISATRFVPNLLLGLPVGALIDRWDRKRVMIYCDLVRFLALGSVPLLAALGHLIIAQLYLVALVEGTAFSFFNIAELAALPRVVPEAHLFHANALNQSAETVSATAGPAFSGYIASLARSIIVGAGLAFLVDSISYLVSVISLCFIHTPFQSKHSPIVWRTLHKEISEGIKFLWTHPSIRFITILGISLSLLYGPMSLAVIVLAQQSFHSDARSIGLLFSLSSIGGVVGSFIAPWIRARIRLGHTIIGAVTIRALIMPLLAGAVSLLMLAIGITIINLLWPVYIVAQLSYRLSIIPDNLQGRVNSNIRLLVFAAESLGTAIGGLLLQNIGPRPVLWIMGAGFAFSALAISFTDVRRA